MINSEWIFLLKQSNKIFELELAQKIHVKNNWSEYELFEINEDEF